MQKLGDIIPRQQCWARAQKDLSRTLTFAQEQQSQLITLNLGSKVKPIAHLEGVNLSYMLVDTSLWTT